MIESTPSVAAQVTSLNRLPMPEIWRLWDRFFTRRPEHTNRTYLESRIAYKLQEEAFGGLATETRRRLEAIGARHSHIKSRTKRQELSFAPGTVLMREWGEREHRVTVTTEGLFEYEGLTSLADIAEAEDMEITQVRRILRLTLLAPDVVEYLVDHPEVSLDPFMRRGWSLMWSEQGEALPN